MTTVAASAASAVGTPKMINTTTMLRIEPPPTPTQATTAATTTATRVRMRLRLRSVWLAGRDACRVEVRRVTV